MVTFWFVIEVAAVAGLAAGTCFGVFAMARVFWLIVVSWATRVLLMNQIQKLEVVVRTAQESAKGLDNSGS